MRYRDFKLTEDELFELKMSPSNLARMAKDIDARAGLEFELVIPDFEGEQEELDPEPDYDMDERFPVGRGWRREVIDFFRGGDSPNSTGYIERQLTDLEENFYGWFDDESENFINSDEGRERALEIAADNVSEDDYETTEQYEAALIEYIDNNGDNIRDTLLDEYREDMDSHWERYLEEENLTTMSDFSSAYNLDWPYWMYPERDGGNFSVDSVAQDFSDAIGRPVTVSSSYHGATRRAGHYAVEPDSSIEGDDGEGGLEFVSPPLPIPEMLADIDKVVKWASRIGAYTNESTGLHMNVSVPQQDQLDFVKLVMFLGDNYILEQFGREGNHYCQSMLDKIKSIARSSPDRVDEMLRQFQGGLNQLASKMVHTGSTSKYSSINVQSNRVEFRSPGGDWMGEYASDPGKVKNTLLRGVVSLGVATDPTAYKQEYYKKLYKTLSQGREDSSIEYFAKYAAGELPKQALKSFIKQLQTKRQVSKDAGSGKLYWWRVFRQGYSGSIEVVAATREEAIDKGTANDGYPSWRGQPDVRAEPLRPYTAEQTPSRDQEFTGTWEVVSRNSNEVVHTIRGIGNAVADAERHAATWQEMTGFDDPVYVRPQMRPRESSRSDMPGPSVYAIVNNHDGEVLLPGQQGTWVYIQTIADNIRNRRNIPRDDIRIVDMYNNHAYLISGQRADNIGGQPAVGGEQSSDANYEIVDRRSATPYPVFRFIANTDQEAGRKYSDWLAARGLPDDTEDYGWRRIENRGIPGSTAELQRQRAEQTPSRDQEFTGHWEVVSRNTDEVVSIISGIGNAVADAERHAARWQQQTGFDDPVYVRPLMRPRDNLSRNQGEVDQAQQTEYRVDYTVTYDDEVRNNSMTVPAANADAAMAAVRNRLERAGWTINRIEADAVNSAARGTESLPPGNTRWLVLDQNDREVYSFVHRSNQGEANQYAANWLRSQGLLGSGEFMVVPAR